MTISQDISIDDKESLSKINISPAELREVLKSNEQFLNSNVDKKGVIGIPFAPRLLESILLASYFKLYFPESASRYNKMVIEVTKKTFDHPVAPATDLNIQERLLNLYFDEPENLERWYTFYQGLVRDALKTDVFYNQIRKSIIFDVIALFSSPNRSTQKKFWIMFQDQLRQLLPYFEGISESGKQVNWNKTYPYLFTLINPNTEKDIALRALEKLFALQNSNGTWFGHHTLTLLILHTIRFKEFELSDLVKEGLEKAESYLRRYLDCGLSVLEGMGIFNTLLYHSMRALFTHEDPPLCLIETLIKYQDNRGGWQFSFEANFSDMDVTSLALYLLFHWWHKTHDPRIDTAINRAIGFISSVRQKDGSFIMYPEATEPLAEMTARGIMVAALLPSKFILKKERFQIITRGLAWLMKKQDKKGFFEDQSYSFSKFYSLSQVALCLFSLERSPYITLEPFKEVIVTIRAKIINYLSENQNSDGSYGSQRPYAEQQSTAYAAFAWALVQPYSKNHVKTLSYLLSTMKRPAKSYPEGTGPRPIRYNDLAHGAIFSHMAISSALSVNNLSQINISQK
ncbi:MAG: prenyltransferase/squalene oxidase repeat-containing protein [Promethearchaeota archaeon]